MFGDLARALQGQGPLNWDAARQFAQLGATGGAAEPNVDPAVRLAFADLARIAWFHVADVIGSTDVPPEPQVVTRSQWASGTLDAYRHLFTQMATALGATGRGLSRRRRRRPDDGDDGRAVEDDGPGDARHGRRLDGRAAGDTGVRHARPADPPPAGHGHARAVEHRRVRRGLEIHRHRRDAAVGARPRARRPRPVRGRPRPRHAERPRPPARRRLPPRSQRRRRSARLARQRGGRSRWPRCSRRWATRRCCSAPSRRPSSSPSARVSTRSSPSSSATPTGSSTPCRCRVDRRQGAATSPSRSARRRVERSASDTFVEQLLGIRLGEEQVARGKAFVQGVVDRTRRPRAGPAARTARRHPHADRGRRARAVAGSHRT